MEDPAPLLFLEVAPLLEKPLEVVKPLPFQIAKDLYAQGFPKVLTCRLIENCSVFTRYGRGGQILKGFFLIQLKLKER